MAGREAASCAADDAETILASRTTPEVFGELVARHEPVLYAYVRARLGHDLALDVVAETFLVGFQRRHRYDLEQPSARPWLFGIAHRVIAGHRREERRRLRALGRLSRVSNTQPSEIERAEDRTNAAAMRVSLFAALAALPAREREVILVMGLADLSAQETAAALGISHGAVRSRLHRARRALRAALASTIQAGQNPGGPSS